MFGGFPVVVFLFFVGIIGVTSIVAVNVWGWGMLHEQSVVDVQFWVHKVGGEHM